MISSGTLKVSLEEGLKKEKFEIIPFGVDTNIFQTNKYCKKIKKYSKYFLLVI